MLAGEKRGNYLTICPVNEYSLVTALLPAEFYQIFFFPGSRSRGDFGHVRCTQGRAASSGCTEAVTLGTDRTVSRPASHL
jgi:hypothetical protein